MHTGTRHNTYQLLRIPLFHIFMYFFAGVANTGGGGGGNYYNGKGISVQSAFTCFLSFSCNVCSSGGNGGSGLVLFKYVA